MAAGAAITLTWLLLRAWLLALWLDKADLVLLAKAVIISGLGVALLGWLQAAADLAGWPASITGLLPRYSHTATYIIPRPQSVALEPLYLAHYLLIPLGLLVAYWLSRRRRLAAAAGLTITSLIVATGSRGGLLGLMALTSLAIIASLWRRPQARKAGMIIALTGGVAALALGLVIWRQYQSRPVAKDVKVERTWRSALAHYVDFNDRSANTRYELWPAAVAQWRQHPWTGVGLYNSRLALHPAAVAAGVPVEQLQPFNNDYLAWLAETGLAGMAAALGLGAVLVLAARQLWRQWSMWGSGWSLALAGMAVQALTFHSLLLLRTWVVVGALLGAFVAQQATKRDEVAL
jgi:O-antigen ligase